MKAAATATLILAALLLSACAPSPAETTDAPATASDTTQNVSSVITEAPTQPVTTIEETVMGKKYFTLSFDDGIEQDERFIALLKKYNISGCTFNINTGLLGQKGNLEAMLGKSVLHNKITRTRVKDGFYSGFEVAVHTFSHPALTNCDDENIIREVTKDEKNITNYIKIAPVGMAYPGGNYYNDHIIDVILANSQIKYARTVTSTYKFSLPERFMEWNPTISASDAKLMSVAKEFIEAKVGDDEALLFYVWGHTYEFDFYESWDKIEEFLSYMSGHDDIEYVTNAQFYNLFKDKIPS